jgi:oligopeptide/dipeptide ABC transporter ATP-binding protein
MADRIAVMYAGQIVEEARTDELFSNPKHPYTQGLIASIPILGELKDELEVIPGNVPNLVNLPPGCRFASRCRVREARGMTICTEQMPELKPVALGHTARCWLYE